jgi:hypothetical protein
VTAAAKVGWIIRAKDRVQTELGHQTGLTQEAEHHNTRASDSELNPLVKLGSGVLQHIQGLPIASAHCTHKLVTIRGQQHELVFGGFTGTYSSMVETPTDEQSPLVLFTDGGWVDSGSTAEQEGCSSPVKPVAAYGVCVADDNFYLNCAQVAGEADMTSAVSRLRQCSALRICSHAGPISGHHTARAYAAELMGILIALAAAPVNWHIEIRSDSESAINSITSFSQTSSVHHRMQEQCHALLRCCAWVIAAKRQAGATVKLTKVKAHDAATTVNAVGNRVADLAVDCLIDSLKAIYDTIHATSEQDTDRAVLRWHDAQWAAAAHDFTFLQHRSHRYIVLASVRAEIKLIERHSLLHGWQKHKNQSRFLVSAMIPVQRQQLDHFRHHPHISSFLLRAFTNSVEFDSRSLFLNESEDTVVTGDDPSDSRLQCCCCAKLLTLSHVLGECKDRFQVEARNETIAAMWRILHHDEIRSDLVSDDIRYEVQKMLGIPAIECSEVNGVLVALGIWNRQDPNIIQLAKSQSDNDRAATTKMRNWSHSFASESYQLMCKSKRICCRSDDRILLPLP